ncbi:MAG: RNA polymerase sigma factor, partial [Planctomycetota bacterium]
RTRADDLLQDSFLQLHRSRETYRPGRPVKPWAFGIARNVYLTDTRSSSRRHKHETRFPLAELSWFSEFDQIASREFVEEALEGLSSDRREALVLHHALGFSFREIGSLLGIREGTAKLRAFRGLQQLRQHLNVE